MNVLKEESVNEEFKSKCTEYYIRKVKESGLPHEEFMRVNDINKAYGRQIHSNNYNDTYPKADMWVSIAKRIGFLENQYWKHIPFALFQLLQGTIGKAHENREICLISGDTGMGKSYNCDWYVKNPFPKSGKAFCFRVPDKEMKPMDFVKGVLKTLGKNSFQEKKANGKLKDKSLSVLTDEIIQYFTANSQDCLLIDEAEYLSTSCWDRVRKIIYELYNKACVVIVGAGIENKLLKMSQRKNALENGHRQFYSRIERKITQISEAGFCRNDEALKEVRQKQNAKWKAVCGVALAEFEINDSEVLEFLSGPLGAKNYRDLESIISEVLKLAVAMRKPAGIKMFEIASAQKRL